MKYLKYILFLAVLSCTVKVFEPEQPITHSPAAGTNPPGELTNVTVKVISSTEIRITWPLPAANSGGYKVSFSKDPVMPVSPSYVLTGGETSLILDNLTPGITCHIWVEYYNNAGVSSPVYTSKVPGPVPASPSFLVVSNNQTSVLLSWMDQDALEDGFYLYYSTNSLQPLTPQEVIPADTLSFTLTAIEPYKKYNLWLEAYNNYDSSYPDTAVITMGLKPAQPDNILVTESGLSAAVSWRDNSFNEDSFNIYWSTTDTKPALPAASAVSGVTNTVITGLGEGTLHYVWVGAENLLGEAVSAYTTVTTKNRPLPPDGLIFTGNGETGLDLSWNDNADNETAYHVYYGESSTKPQTPDIILGSDAVSTTVTVTPYVTTWFWIEAVNLVGPSTPLSTNITAGFTPAPPSALNININGIIALLSWQDNSGSELGYNIYYSTINTKPDTPSLSLPADTTNKTITMASGLTTYYFWVESYNAVGPSATDITGTATTSIVAPVITKVIFNSDNHLQVWWDDTTNEDGYRFYISESNIKPAGFEFTSAADSSYAVDVNAGDYIESGKDYTIWCEAYAGTNAAWDSMEFSTPPPPTPQSNVTAVDNIPDGAGFSISDSSELLDGVTNGSASVCFGINDNEMGSISPWTLDWLGDGDPLIVDPLWVYLDFASNISPQLIKVYYQTDNVRAQEYSLQYLADGSNPATDTWLTITNVSGNTEKNTSDLVTSVTARYIRLYIADPTTSSPNPNWGLKWFEIEVIH